ncbi:isoprenoid synthase domain-containing protein [Aspergillus pseudotamarii]|uniref:Isoprenoid synthase domain-containing protein n=1 Tax=Aspergillus pseudotamarii TaxID=132259 RepID=A0A5N6T7U5_ASPPS|nr:isoprenoid synthase domain-containing protein [Aspergillus pseudotamarii]KAE8142372.1 isoprenoid synthase domain-containing protein [Aspergillus pseudotamarii]
MCVRLMQAQSDLSRKSARLMDIVNLLGRYFQIRDDYQNLISAEYSREKGFCKDLDEGKVSLPLIYYMRCPESMSAEVKSLLFHRPPWEELPVEMKGFIIAEMEAHGALDKTYTLIREVKKELLDKLRELEEDFEVESPVLHLILQKLRLDNNENFT